MNPAGGDPSRPRTRRGTALATGRRTNRRLTVCLTGGIGSGKSSVARLFAERGIEVIDADALAHDLTRSGGAAIPPLVDAFGVAVLDASGALDRARMRRIAFADAAARARLESILHPLIRAESARRAAAATSPYVMLMIPLLVESGKPRRRCDRVLVVDCPEEEQVRRVMVRSTLSCDEVHAIIAAQAGRASRLEHADDVIDNGGAPSRLAPQVDALHRRYLALAARASFATPPARRRVVTRRVIRQNRRRLPPR
ncbi:MAG: dephospho-CoA kinase [Burkholderiales bacterium]